MLLLFLLAVFTALNLLAGFILLYWRNTRPFGLYALLVEPGGVAGLLVAALLWREFLNLIVRYQTLGSDWMVWALVVVAVVWLGAGAVAGGVSGFALATWLWWRFSPEPYRSKIVNGYRRFVTMPPFHRQRWKQRREAGLTTPFDSE
jgi:hypothetical protein